LSAQAFDRERALQAWGAAEHRDALTPADHAAVDATGSVRGTILDFALRRGQDEELYDACAIYGRLLAEGGSSPSLAATAIDRACEALGDRAPAWATAARAAMAEGFGRAREEVARNTTNASWDFPAPAVRLDATTLAIAASHPSDDDETLAGWAAKAARAAAFDGVRRVVVSGRERPRAALAEALAIAGILCVEAATPSKKPGG
jgi:hypothetical protein